MANSPIQIVLNSSDFIGLWQRPPGGQNKDFYAGEDEAFVVHKKEIQNQLLELKTNLKKNQFSEISYAKLILKQSALAKSHRPTGSLFKKELAPVVGAGDLGELFVELKPSSIDAIYSKINTAEEVTRYKTNKEGKTLPNPSIVRSELGAIEEIRLYDIVDKRKFSIVDGLEWISNPQTGGAYIIELFESVPPRQEWDNLTKEKLKLFQTFIDGLLSIGKNIQGSNLLAFDIGSSTIGIRLQQSSETSKVQLSISKSAVKRKSDIIRINQDINSHTKLINFLDKHPLVKKINLPPIIKRSSSVYGKIKDKYQLPKPVSNKTYPKMAIVDGGVSTIFNDWIIERWGLLSPDDKDEAHGTFIAGLAISGSTLNGSEICKELDGCEIIDLDILPKEAFFGNYFVKPLEFFKELEIAVKELKERTGVRIFNFSLNITEHVSSSGYSVAAKTLDKIAEENDIIFVISVGNTEQQDIRKEWPNDPSEALSILAASRNDTIKVPSESCRNLSIASVNPPNLKGIVPFAPSNYTCRGPGIRIGLKPDLAHVGGSGTKVSGLGHGLYSIDQAGNIIDGCGTSYSTPNVAKSLACIDHLIEGHLSRETLMGLIVHNAMIPDVLKDKKLQDVAKHLVGFGIPSSSQEIIEGNDHSITLVFANRIYANKKMSFNFTWPASLVVAGKCKGHAKLTIVSTPPLDYKYGAEFVRVNIEGHLRQEQEDGHYIGRLNNTSLSSNHMYEKNQIEHSYKWSTIKVFEKNFKGVGPSTNWRLEVEYLARDGQLIPSNGIPFTVLLTISDPKGKEPVFKDMHQSLQALGVKIVDIKNAARILQRI
ncbi:MAG: S8 family peptidase [Chitinophagaceae bacterium]|nr:S8 family peptidase [Chitinophagaceae bacterium]